MQCGDNFACMVVEKAENERVGVHGFDVESGKRAEAKMLARALDGRA